MSPAVLECMSNARVAVLTAGRDKPYALGLAAALMGRGICFDFIGSTVVDAPELHGNPQVNCFIFRDQRENVSTAQKVFRVLIYYGRMIRYAVTSKAPVFHILWNNKFELFDRTLLMLFYRLLGKRLVLTAHNVNIRKRDGNDTWVNRTSLRIQYRLADHTFVHTRMMRDELVTDFGIDPGRVSVIPFGINNTLPATTLSRPEAREHLGLGRADKTLLFFGNIAPYKGLEYLAEALALLSSSDSVYRLVIAGRPKGFPDYWRQIQDSIRRQQLNDRVIERIEYIPDEQVEIYFKAADVLLLPYTHIFQSGVLFLGYSFGLPIIATDVGSLKQEIIVGKTGFVCRPRDTTDLARAIEQYFSSDLYRNLDRNRQSIRDYANERYSWTKVGEITAQVYSDLLNTRH